MANYSLVIDSKFSPFTYQELLHPVMAATQAHQALETEYGNLESAADLIASKVNETKDPESYKRYTAYYNALKAKADQLSREGLNTTSRRDMLNLKSNFNKQIKPIADAIDRRKELEKEQRTAIAANPTLRYERMAKNMSLDTFVDNPEADYGQSYSGALLMSQVSQAVASYAKTLTKKGKLKGNGLPFQYQQDLQYGASPEQVMQTIIMNSLKGDAEAQRYLNSISDKSDREAIKYLNGVVNQVITSSKIRDWADENTFKELMSFANQGLYSAVGQALIKDYQDTYGMQVAAERRAAARAARASKDSSDEGTYINSKHQLNNRPIVSSLKVEGNAKKLQQFVNNGLIKKVGNKYVITNKGWREYNKITYTKHNPNPYAVDKFSIFNENYSSKNHRKRIKEGYNPSNSAFHQFINSFNTTKSSTGKNISSVKVAENVLNTAYKKVGDMYDLYNSTELVYNTNGNSAMTNALLSSLVDDKNQVFRGQVFQPGKGFVDGSGKYTIQGLKNNYELTSLNATRHDITAVFIPKSGDSDRSVRIKIPKNNVNPTIYNNVVQKKQDAYDYQRVLDAGFVPKEDKNHKVRKDSRGNILYTNIPLNDDKRFYYSALQESALYDADEYLSNLIVIKNTKTDDYEVIPTRTE